MGLGPLSAVSLAVARQKAAEARATRAEGRDPIDVRRAAVKRVKLAAAKAMTFKSCTEAYFASHRPSWRNARHADDWRASLERHAYPVLGELPIAAVDTEAVLAVLQPIWTTRTETASRVRGRIESILDAARAQGLRTGENPARWRGHLDHLLPRPTKVRRVVHFTALPYTQLPELMARLASEKRGQPSIAIVLEALSRALPDNAWLDRLEVGQGMVTLAGTSTNAANLIARVEGSGHFAHAQFAAPTTRIDGGNHESFSITAEMLVANELEP